MAWDLVHTYSDERTTIVVEDNGRSFKVSGDCKTRYFDRLLPAVEYAQDQQLLVLEQLKNDLDI